MRLVLSLLSLILVGHTCAVGRVMLSIFGNALVSIEGKGKCWVVLLKSLKRKLIQRKVASNLSVYF